MQRFPIVGVGASAGGLEAFSQLLEALPNDTGMAFVLIQHLAPDHDSVLVDLLAKMSKMPVLEAVNGMPTQPNHVYVIPPTTDLTISGDNLTFLERKPGPGSHMPVDIFLRALAESREAQAIAIILSGSGSDGSYGLQEIRSRGGCTFAQDPKTARFDSMPRSAIATRCVDFTLSPTDIAQELVRMAHHPYFGPDGKSTETASAAPDTLDIVRRIQGILRTRSGVDFRAYKAGTIMRRIQRRMLSCHVETLDDYLRYLQSHPEEPELLYNDILIKVTKFFRDSETFDELKSTIYGQIIKARPTENAIRIWVPGCSTGEEVYSHAMSLLEFLGEHGSNTPVQIFGTDISDEALDAARRGSYLENIEQDVSPERLQRFFTKTNDRYLVNKSVRDLCVFAKQNFLKDPPFSRLDLVSCRNVLIYLSPDLQKRVMPIFHFALNPSGLLLLGSAETTGVASDLFTCIDKTHKLFAKKIMTTRMVLDFPGGPTTREDSHAFRGPAPKVDAGFSNIQKETQRALIERYAPAGVVVNTNGDVLQFIGNTVPYLQNPPGEADLNLMRMVREGLQPSINEMLKTARQDKKVSTKPGLSVEWNGNIKTIDLEVVPMSVPLTTEVFFAVMFKEVSEQKSSASAKSRSKAAPEATPDQRWKEEMTATKVYLESVISEKDAAFEELQSANEEILSNNEELQSINEEVQTGKEELQSTNEELVTVNDELHHTNLQSAQLVGDLNNLLESVSIPIVIVDSALKIRRFTARAQKILNLIPADIGRPLGDVNMHLVVSNLRNLISEVIESGRPNETQVKSEDGHWFLVRIRPTKTSNGPADGAVVILIDVDAMKRTEDEIVSARDMAESTLATIREPLVVLQSDFRVLRASANFYRAFGGSREDTEGRLFFEVGGAQWNIPKLRTLLEAVVSEDHPIREFEIDHVFKSVGRRTVLLNAAIIRDSEKESHMDKGLILLAIEDVTERREAERKLIQSNRDLEDFAHVVSHDLQSPLHQIVAFGDLLTKDIGEALNDAGRRHIDRIQTSAMRMVRLIKSVLDYSKASLSASGKTAEEVEMSGVFQWALLDLEADISARNATVTAENLPRVIANRAQMNQLLANLIGNALKYQSDEAPIIHVAAKQKGAVWEFAISDNGVGIAKDHRERVFDLFQRTRETERPGNGIGLSICKKIVASHRGRIWVESELSRGSTFYFTLPIGALTPAPADVRVSH